MRTLLLCALLAGATRVIAVDLSEYCGRYQQQTGHVLIVSVQADRLTIRPLFWRSTQRLERAEDDRFVVTDRPDRSARFLRDERGAIVAVETTGLGSDLPAPLITSSRPVAAELLMRGDGKAAARALESSRPDAISVALDFAEFVNRALPTRANALASFLGELAKIHSRDATLHAAHGDALVAAGRRDSAIAAYTAALALAPENPHAAAGLRMLRQVEPVGGWTVPFTMDELFAGPSDAEISRVVETWAARDLRPRNVRVEARIPMRYESTDAEIRIVSHRIRGSLHYGAVIVPVGATTGSCAVVVEAKGVSPSFFPLSLDDPPYTVRFLGREAARFIIVLPSYRGEILKIGAQTYSSEGDRSDSWDGAADDAIAFLNAALKVTPEADPSRIGIFGKSRGGTVALLAAARAPRFRCVVAWSAPTDHFVEMVQSGWLPRERTAEGLRQKSPRDKLAGQLIDTFLRGAIEGEEDLHEVRRHIVASSPLYFADRLPPAQVHYGDDDNVVCSGNGRALERRVADKSRLEAIYYPAAGHDLDQDAAFENSRRFLQRGLSAAESSTN
jgi:tetratricopeptide (TPR) repeat protein